ncbi:unnamed protein product, partial [Rotaria magnacalcarata]
MSVVCSTIECPPPPPSDVNVDVRGL